MKIDDSYPTPWDKGLPTNTFSRRYVMNREQFWAGWLRCWLWWLPSGAQNDAIRHFRSSYRDLGR